MLALCYWIRIKSSCSLKLCPCTLRAQLNLHFMAIFNKGLFYKVYPTFPVGPLRVMRVISILRSIRVLRYFNDIYKLLLSIIIALPSVINVAMMMMVVIVMFALIGMQLFKYVALTGQFTENVNFSTFAKSLLMMFRLSTMTCWDGVLTATSVQPPYCDRTFNDIPNGNCGYPTDAYIFMFIYIIVVGQLIVSLFVAVIIDSFEDASFQNANIPDLAIEQYYIHWAKFDPEASQFIPFRVLPQLLRLLNDTELKVPGTTLKAIASLNLTLYENETVHCADLLQALVRHAQGTALNRG